MTRFEILLRLSGCENLSEPSRNSQLDSNAGLIYVGANVLITMPQCLELLQLVP